MPPPDSDSGQKNQRQPNTSLSSLLLDTAAQFESERVKVRDITETLGHRSFGFILLMFAIPNSLPIVGIPGVSAITGLPMLLVAVQMMLNHKRVYLPRWIADSSVATSDFRRIIEKVVPWLKRFEKLLRPRIDILTRGHADRWLGAVCALLSFFLILPIPFGNLIPGVGILFIALGLIERDGICVLIGLGLGITSVAYLGGLVWVILNTLIALIGQFFGA
jgi:hypothetical protein